MGMKKKADQGSRRNAPQAMRASHGEIIFDDNVQPPMRETVREMWANRLLGFRARDLSAYLRDNTESTLYIVNNRTWSFAAFRRFNRVLFFVRRITGWVGLGVDAEALDIRVSRESDCYVARGWLVLSIRGIVFRQSRLIMPATEHNGRCVWLEANDTALPRRQWRYVAIRNDAGFARAAHNAQQEQKK